MEAGLETEACDALVGAATALLGEWAHLDVIAAVSGQPLGAVADAVARLQGAGSLDGVAPARFTDDDARAACAAGVPEPRRRLMRGAIADALRRRGAPDGDVAAHLLRAPGAAVAANVATLRRCARGHLHEGRGAEAVACLERALLEPPAPAELAGVLVELADALLDGGLHMRALAAARRARAQSLDPSQRASAAARAYRALAALRSTELAIAEIVGEIDAIRPVDPNGALELERVLLGEAPNDARVLEVGLARFAAQSVDESLPAAGPYLLTAGQILAMGGHTSAEQAVRTTRRALALGAIGNDRDIEPVLRCAWLLIRADCHDEAGRLLRRFRARVPARRDHPALRAFEGLIALRAGSVTEAAGRLSATLSDARRRNDRFAYTAAAAFLAHAMHEADQRELLERLLAEHELLPADPDSAWTAILLIARGRQRLRSGRPADALRDLMAVEHRKRELGLTNPAGFHQAEVAVEALLELDRPDDAHDLAELNLRRARAWGTPRTLALAQRACARCMPAGEGAEVLARSLATLRDDACRLPRARLALDLGRMLLSLNRRRDAERALRGALDGAARINALRIAREARAELSALGLRPRRAHATGVEALTRAELRVARLAAEGHSNKQIAARLHLSVRTVENQLRGVYGKLAVRRGGLAAVLGESLRA